MCDNWSDDCECDVSILIGHTLKSVEKVDDELIFVLESGVSYKLFHESDCCESVWIEDIDNDLSVLAGNPILMAEESENEDVPPPESEFEYESYTWTFYKFATIKGHVTIRFFGESNGYYSESVSWVRLDG